MFKQITMPIVILCIAAASMILSGCEGDQGPEGAAGIQGPQGEPGPIELNIVASLQVFNDKAYERACLSMSMYNAPSIPDVWLNDTVVSLEFDPLITEGRLEYSKCMYPDRTDSAFLDISYTMLDGSIGTASSDIPLPGEFSVINPQFEIPIGGDAIIEWTASEGADGYWLVGDVRFYYDDTLGAPIVNYVTIDTVVSAPDTTLTIPGSLVFPDSSEIGVAHNYDGWLYIRGVTGPWFPGEVNNVSGDAFGIFVGITEYTTIHIELEPDLKSYDEEPVDSRIDADNLLKEKLRELSRR